MGFRYEEKSSGATTLWLTVVLAVAFGVWCVAERGARAGSNPAWSTGSHGAAVERAVEMPRGDALARWHAAGSTRSAAPGRECGLRDGALESPA